MSPIVEGRVAVLGLGIIGSRAATRLLDAGWSVVVWNRTPKGLAYEVGSPQAAVGEADLVSVYLKDGLAVREIFQTLTTTLQPGQIILNHATIDLETTHWLVKFCESRGCRFLDAPFTGSKVAAANGQLIYYLGGDPALATELDEYLAITSKARLHCGAVGAATVLKLATNLISACTAQAMAEALAIATHHGVTGERLAQAVAQNASGSALTAMKFPLILAGNYEPHFSLANMLKDSRYMLELVAASQLDTPAIAAVSQRMASLCEKGLGDDDFSVLAKPYLEG